MSMILHGDGLQKPIIQIQSDSVFHNVTVAASGAENSAHKFLHRYAGNPTLIITGAGSADTDIMIRQFFNPYDAAAGDSWDVLAGVDFTATAFIMAALINPLVTFPVNLGWIDIRLENNDGVNDLTGVYARILIENV